MADNNNASFNFPSETNTVPYFLAKKERTPFGDVITHRITLHRHANSPTDNSPTVHRI